MPSSGRVVAAHAIACGRPIADSQAALEPTGELLQTLETDGRIERAGAVFSLGRQREVRNPVTGEAIVIHSPLRCTPLAYDPAALAAAQGPAPFVFVGQGSAFARKCLEGAIGFAVEPDAAQRDAIEASIPAPLSCRIAWGSRGLCFGSDDAYEYAVADLMSRARRQSDLDAAIQPGDDGMPTDRAWSAFEARVVDWCRRLHAAFGVSFVVLASSEVPGVHEHGAWHRASVAQRARVTEAIAGLPAESATWIDEVWASAP
jgi:hypothetical protein